MVEGYPGGAREWERGNKTGRRDFWLPEGKERESLPLGLELYSGGYKVLGERC